jgi:hypothetical protein
MPILSPIVAIPQTAAGKLPPEADAVGDGADPAVNMVMRQLKRQSGYALCQGMDKLVSVGFP